MLLCSQRIRNILIYPNPALQCDDFDILSDGQFRTATIRGDTSGIEQLTVTKHHVVGLNRERFPSLQVVRVKPGVVPSLQAEFSCTQVIYVCSACWRILQKKMACGRCKYTLLFQEMSGETLALS